MATITVYGGDFKAGQGSYLFKQFNLKSNARTWLTETITIPLDRLAKLETVSLENNGRDTLSTAGRAVVGELLAGPIGAIVAAGTAKGRNQVTFLATFDDNRQFLGATNSETFKSWMGALLTRRRMEENEAAKRATETSQAPSAIRQQAPLPAPTGSRRMMVRAIVAAASSIILIAIFNSGSRTPPQQQQQQEVVALPSKSLDELAEEACNVSGAIPNCKEVVAKQLAEAKAHPKPPEERAHPKSPADTADADREWHKQHWKEDYRRLCSGDLDRRPDPCWNSADWWQWGRFR